MAESRLQVIRLSVVAAVAITLLTAAAPLNVIVSHSINLSGELSQICTTQTTHFSGGLPIGWITDAYNYCGGYRDKLSFTPPSLAADLAIWFVVAMAALDLMRKMNSKKGRKMVTSFLPPLPRTSGRGLFPLSP